MIEIDTSVPTQVIDITSHVEKKVKGSGILSGICVVYTMHTTTAVTVNEAESGLLEDMFGRLESIAPRDLDYRHHGDENAHAHIKAALIGGSAVIPVAGGRLVLGTWQKVLFIELDGPRRRHVLVSVISG